MSSELVVIERGDLAYKLFCGQPKSRADVVNAKLAQSANPKPEPAHRMSYIKPLLRC